jgi:hypothetical protein
MRKQQPSATESRNLALPNTITFPYSRHSSYPELCNLVQAFKPRDVWPCTVDVPRWLFEGLTSLGDREVAATDSIRQGLQLNICSRSSALETHSVMTS